MNNVCARWLISPYACSNLPAEAHSARYSIFHASCRLSSFFLLISISSYWRRLTRQLQTMPNSLHHMCSVFVYFHGLYHESVSDYTSFNCSLSNYALYHDTMPLNEYHISSSSVPVLVPWLVLFCIT